jgi:hypothetical protein
LSGGHIQKPGIRLTAGKLTMLYENGSIRYISSGENEIIRMIYVAVRDRDWLTIIPEISDEKVDLRPDSFTISYKCAYKSGEINFLAAFRIEGKSDNSLIFSLEGEALTTFEKNRIGFCVLHPLERYIGTDCTIIHSDNSTEICKFPAIVSPNQPFLDISAMKWKIDDSTYTLNFIGEIFETEDQRNWTDASYKTYCTPLTIPFPAKVNKGEKIIQSVEFRAESDSFTQKTYKERITLTLDPEDRIAYTKIGIGRSTRPQPLSEAEINILRNLKFDHYRIDIFLFRSDWKTIAVTALTEATELNYPVEFALFFDENAVHQVTEFIEMLYETNPIIAAICLYHKDFRHTPDSLTDVVAPVLRKKFPGINIASGTNSNFAQLNRNRPESVNSNLICYSIHPQEHASDNLTLVENLEAQKYTVESALNFSNGKGIWVSPVNIQRRFNANIGNFETQIPEGELPQPVDSRLMSLFGACWAAGSLKYLCESDAEGVTYFETAGERGLLQGDYDSRWPAGFQAAKGMIFPIFHVFRFILKYKSFKVVRSISSHPLMVELLTLTDGKEYKLIVINLTHESHDVILPVHGKYKTKQLNSDSFAKASSDINWIETSFKITTYDGGRFLLPPFSTTFIE